MVASFKKDAGETSLSKEQSFFNTEIGSIWVVVPEHCIAILKNRFFIDFNDEVPELWYENLDNDHY
jgi:hypothetical protein